MYRIVYKSNPDDCRMYLSLSGAYTSASFEARPFSSQEEAMATLDEKGLLGEEGYSVERVS